MALDIRRILEDLNPQQREAVEHPGGPLLVLAGAGSGKTRVITHRIAYLMARGTDPDAILAITFTNKAAGEMRERAERLCGMRSAWISTFHSFAARVLRRHIHRIEPYNSAFTIIDRDDARTLVREVIKELDVDPHLWDPASVLSEISSLKNSAAEEEAFFGADYLRGQVLRSIYGRYMERLRRGNLLDFDDLLLLLVKLFREHEDVLAHYRRRFEHVLIDEYQDTNALQYAIGRLLTAEHRNICITGDPDQSIYSWRGADIGNILLFEEEYPDARVILLEQNYRSTKNILHVANALIAHNVHRKPKELWTTNPDGEPVRVFRTIDEEHEAREVAALIRRLLDEGVSPGDIAVFYRINSLSRTLEQELIFANIPYTIVGGVEFFVRKEIKDLLAYLRILVNPRDSESLRRVINTPPRGIGAATLEKLERKANELKRGLLDIVLDADLRPELGARAARALDRFSDLYRELETLARSEPGVERVLRAVIERSGYEEHLRASRREEDAERLANVGELLGAAVEYDRANPEGTLQGFLELTAILGDVDRWERRADRVSLMTLHAAKGLEFPVVIIVAVEDGILPLLRASDPEPDIEEERRLLYVGITRARERLFLTHAACRKRFGQSQRAYPSRFLRELEPPADSALDAFQRLEMDLATEESLHAPRRRSRWHAGGDFDDDEAFDEGSSAWDIEYEDLEPSDDAFDLDEDPFPVGARVWHDAYGEGQVVRVSGLGLRRRVTVRFEEAGEKQFVAGFAALRRIR